MHIDHHLITQINESLFWVKKSSYVIWQVIKNLVAIQHQLCGTSAKCKAKSAFIDRQIYGKFHICKTREGDLWIFWTDMNYQSKMILEKAILTVNKIRFILSFVIASNEIKFMYNYQKRKKNI